MKKKKQKQANLGELQTAMKTEQKQAEDVFPRPDASQFPVPMIEVPKGCVVIDGNRIPLAYIQRWHECDGISRIYIGGGSFSVDIPIAKLDRIIMDAMEKLK